MNATRLTAALAFPGVALLFVIGSIAPLFAHGSHGEEKTDVHACAREPMHALVNRFDLPALDTLRVSAWKDNPTLMFVNRHSNASCAGVK